MRTAARITAWSAAGVLGLGIAAGAAAAATAPPPVSPHPTTTAQHAQAAGTPHPGKAKRALLRRSVHGELTVKTKNGYQQVALQRGVVGAVSATSISLRSPDGFPATYVVTKDTVVRAQRKPVAISEIKVGDRAVVVAKHTGSSLSATRIMCVRPPKAGPATRGSTSTS